MNGFQFGKIGGAFDAARDSLRLDAGGLDDRAPFVIVGVPRVLVAVLSHTEELRIAARRRPHCLRGRLTIPPAASSFGLARPASTWSQDQQDKGERDGSRGAENFAASVSGTGNLARHHS
jgi:hypothetical protein